MSRTAHHFSRQAKALLYGLLLTRFGSGSLWFILHAWFITEGEFGPTHSPWEQLLLQLHGASAFLMMITFGWALGRHVPVGWRTQRSRKSGTLPVATLCLMVISGYGLYYIGDEQWHEITVWIHLVCGFSLPMILGVHIWIAIQRRRLLTDSSAAFISAL